MYSRLYILEYLPWSSEKKTLKSKLKSYTRELLNWERRFSLQALKINKDLTNARSTNLSKPCIYYFVGAANMVTSLKSICRMTCIGNAYENIWNMQVFWFTWKAKSTKYVLTI